MQGSIAKAAYRAAPVAWGAVWSNVDTLLTFRSESLTREYHRVRSMALLGDAAAPESQAGIQKVSGDLVCELDYNNLGMFQFALGAHAGGVYSLTNDLPCFHLEIEKGTTRYRYRSCIVNSITISGTAEAEEPILVTYNLTAYRVDTTATAFPALTLTSPKRVLFSHLEYTRVGDLVDALASGDGINLSGLEMMINHNLKTDDVSSLDNQGVMVPLRNGFREATSKLTFPRYDANASTVIGFADSDTRLQMTWRFLSGGEAVLIEFAQGKVMQTPSFPVQGPQVLTDTAELHWYRNEANTFMAAVPQLRITVV